MGQTSTKVVKKLASPFMGWGSTSSSAEGINGNLAITPFVYSRQGSMYFDEDGDLAHEFYEEVNGGNDKGRMQQNWNVVPQGEVKLPHPRLNMDFPVVLCEAPIR